MQENNMDQPTSLSQLLRESYLSEARAHHRHSESSCTDPPRRLVYGALKDKTDDSGGKEETQFPDLSAFLNQEELDKSVDLACKAISDEPQEREDKPDGSPQVRKHNVPSSKPTFESELMTEKKSVQPAVHDNMVRNVRTSREPPADFKRPPRNSPYGLETQSKKEFLNKAADFIEELSSLFKANSSKRVRPRNCKAHRSRNQNKIDGVTFDLNAEGRERPVLLSQQVEELVEFEKQSNVVEEPYFKEEPQKLVPPCGTEVEVPVLTEVESTEEPEFEPPHFIQKLKSREVEEGSKVQLDCTVRGRPTPEVRWFCEGKELENSPDIQIISDGERHSLIIAEAFEEDTGRYSCFASSFCGTDSTSAEIYIEGASSSDSDREQHFPAELQKKPPQPKTDVISAPPSLSAEDCTAAAPTPCLEQPAPSETEDTPLSFDPPSMQGEPELLSSEVVSSQVPELEASVPTQEQPMPTSQVELYPETPQLTSPSAPADQSISNLLSVSQQSSTENQNGSSSYLQNFDVRPLMAAPVFTKNLQDVLAQEGQLVVLECRVNGIPSPKVDWYREGTVIDDSPDFRILQKKPRSMAESEEICTLVIAEVFPEDSGTFTCTASNKYGTISSVAVLRVKGRNNQTTSSKATSNLTLESPQQKVLATEPMIFKFKPDIPLIHNKLETNMIFPDASSSDSMQSETLDTRMHVKDSLNSSKLGREFATSLPNLNPLSIGKYHSDTFRSSLPQLDPLSINVSQLDPLNSDSKHKPFGSVTSHFDLGGSGFSSSAEATQCPSNGSAENSSIDHEQPHLKPLPDPPTSCLKTRPEGLLANHSEQRSSSRAGLRVTFRLPEDEKSLSPKDKEPPPILAKPKLDPVQLQILHNQVLLEQQQDGISSSPESPRSDRTSCEPQPVPPASNSVLSQLRAPHLVMNPKAAPVTQLNMSTTQQNLTTATLSMPSVIPTTQLTTTPNIPMTLSNLGLSPQFITASTTQSNTNHSVNLSQITPSTHISQINMTPTPQMNSVPIGEVDITVVKTHPLMTPVSNTSAKLNTSPVTHPSMASPLLQENTNSQNVSSAPQSKISAPAGISSLVSAPPLNSIQVPLPSSFPVPTQSFNYTRPKEFIAAQTLSPIRSPSPTESPVPMLHELAAQIFPKSREVTSPVNQFTPSPRKLPTRILESVSSPPAYVSSPPPVPPGLVNSVFSFRPQSPPQASSPTSSTSSPSPIQNPVAFLSSVLPSLPTSPPTNAMGLPKRAPPRPSGVPQKNQRAPRPLSEELIRDSREILLRDIEKKLQFKDEPLRFGQQKPSGDVSRPLQPNVQTATVINYDEEYKVSNFEQRLMSEIEFRLERTPVEESDDEVQHEEIPTGKCIAPIFDRKLKNYRAVEGVPVTFTCKVVGIPIPKVYWFKDGKQILKKNEHYQKIREGDGLCSLHIKAATSDDDGNYTVMAANPQGRISCSGHLIVQTGPMRNRPTVQSQRVRARVQEVEGEPIQERFFRPHFLQAPGDMMVHEGRLCRLDCKVSGLPHPEIMWLLNGKPIYPDLTHRMLVRENGIHSLVIDPVSQTDDGTYTCIASNKAGQSSFCLELRVMEKEMKQAPHFLEKLQNVGIAEGAPVRLECRVVGMPQPLIYWKKDNETISHSKERRSMHQDTTGYVCLLIQPTRKEDAGWYTVSAKNEAGIISCTARLDIYAQWHQHVHPPMRKTQLTGSRHITLTDQDVTSAFPTGDRSSVLFSGCQSEPDESEEL